MRPPCSTTEIVWAAASRRDHIRATCLSGGGIGRIVPRSGQVPTTTSAPASRSRRTASERWRIEVAGSTWWVMSLTPISTTARSRSVGSAASTWTARWPDSAPTTANDRRWTRRSAPHREGAGQLRRPASPRPGRRRSRRRWSRRAARPAPPGRDGRGRTSRWRRAGECRGAGRSPCVPATASVRSTPYSASPSADSPPPPNAAAEASLRAAAAFPTAQLYGAGECAVAARGI